MLIDATRRTARLPWLLVGATSVFVVLALLPGRTHIPPLIESDYCYQLIAADRMYEGHGLTSLQPIAPLQPWDWQYDWGFLTQWPVGYPLIVWAVRWVTGLGTIAACQWISVAACTIALVGWFVWLRRSMPGGVTTALLASVAAGCSVTVALLINPTTDAILAALLPVALLMTSKAVEASTGEDHTTLPAGMPSSAAGPGRPDRSLVGSFQCAADGESSQRAMMCLAFAGLVAGGMFWIRYASVFVPLGIAVYLLVERALRHKLAWRHISAFALGAVLPVGALLLLSCVFGIGTTQLQLNLGRSVGFHFTPAMLGEAWWNFTDFGFYNYHWFSHWVFALWPIALVAVAAVWHRHLAGVSAPFKATLHFFRRAVGPRALPSASPESTTAGAPRGLKPAARGEESAGPPGLKPAARGDFLHAFRSFALTPGVCLGACVTAALFAVLIGATTLFGDKFDYVAHDRYYQPIKPLYFLLFAAPIVLIPRRVVRVAACAALLVACSWLVQQEWPGPYKRWLAANRETTPYGQWARCFAPGTAALYDWLKECQSPELVVVSNFHEYIALETGIPALPIPKNEATLTRWLARIRSARNITTPRVLFVLDPDNKWRDYWMPEVEAIVAAFGLNRRVNVSGCVSALVFEYAASRPGFPVPATSGESPCRVALLASGGIPGPFDSFVDFRFDRPWADPYTGRR